MKTTGFLLLSSVLFFYSDIAMAELSIDCSSYPRPICTLDYRPHCGVIRNTYSNKCDFCNTFVESRGKLQLEYYGECSKGNKEVAKTELPIDCSGYPRRACTKEYEPLCGSVHHTYSNKCAFCNAFVESSEKLQLESYGKCSEGAKE